MTTAVRSTASDAIGLVLSAGWVPYGGCGVYIDGVLRHCVGIRFMVPDRWFVTLLDDDSTSDVEVTGELVWVN